jgi:hypothetical protein
MVKIKQDLKTALLNGGEWGIVEAEKKGKIVILINNSSM